MKKFLTRTAIVLGCLIGLWFILMALRKPWIEPIPGVRLKPTRPILLEKDVKPDSAFDLLRRAGKSYTVPKNQEGNALDEWKHMPWSLVGATNTLAVLEQTKDSLALARRAAEAPDPQTITPTSFHELMPYVATTRSIARCFNMSAKARAIRGDYSGAFAELQSAIGFSSILSCGGVMIHHLVSIAGCNMSCATMRRIALSYPVQDDLLRNTIPFLDHTENGLEPWVECMRHECIVARSCVDEVLRESFKEHPSELYLMDHTPSIMFLGRTPSIMKKDMDACFTHLVSMAQKPYDQTAYDRFELSIPPDSVLSRLKYRDPLGQILARLLLLPPKAAAHARHVSMISGLRATRIVLAIVMFKRDEGRLPQKLDELTPKYLDKIPDDPFDGKQMKYRVNADGTWVVYSVSYDGKDDGGVEDPKLGRGKPDLIFGPTESP